jgi:hypothetical protein
MLLRVDVYPHTTAKDAVGTDQLPPPSQSLYVSLHTSTGSATLLTVGRKDSNVVLQGDKSVSRQHMSLELVSSSTTEGESSPRAPEGSVEIEACKKENVVVVLKDSSRFGTFVITDTNTNNDDDETSDEATDDEGQAAASSSQQISSQFSSIATKLVNPTSARSDKVEGPTVLATLSAPNGRAIIQCGQNGSTLVIENIPIRVVLSRAPKATKELWASRCSTLGVTLLETIDEHATHLVTADRITNAKSLVAWFLKKPMVTFAYLEALWDRTSPDEALPDAADFAPQPGDKEAFWEEEPQRGLWSHCTLLSYAGSDDMEALCRAAGATIIELYNANDPIQEADEAMQTHKGCFFINSSNKAHAKLVKHLKKAQIPPLTQKSLALFISKQEPLKDSHDNLIGTPSAVEEEDVVPVEKEQAPEAAASNDSDDDTAFEGDDDDLQVQDDSAEKSKDTPKSQSHPVSKKVSSPDQEEEDTEPLERPSTSRRASRKRKSSPAPDDKEEASSPLDTSMDAEPLERPSTSRASKSQRVSQQSREEASSPMPMPMDGGEPLERPSTSRASRKRRSAEQETAVAEEESPEKPTKKNKKALGGWTDVRKQAPEEEETKKEVEVTDEANEEEEEEEVIAAPDEDEEVVEKMDYQGTRKTLPKTKDGWLVAAPRDRRAFKATEGEVLDSMGDDVIALRPTAETDVIKGLVVAAKGQAARGGSQQQSGTKDFKRFRKNSIIRVGEISRIQMRTVLPKQSEKQAKLQDEQAELEASLREADALFRDQGGGSIRNHFSARGKKTRKV